MQKTGLLFVAKICCKAFIILWGISFVTLTALFIHWQVDRDFYSNIPITVRKDANFSSKVEFNCNNEGDSKNLDTRIFYMDNLKIESVYFNYFQLTGLLFIVFLVIKNCLKVIDSVESLQTFRVGNIESFKKIGKLCFLYFILGGITYIKLQNGSIFSISIQFIPLIIAIAAYIISDIFKEGNNLLEENALTI